MPKDDSAIFEACIWKDKLTEIYRHFFISLSQINTNDELVSTGSNNFESMTKQFTEEIAKIKSALKLKKDFNLVNKYSGKKQGCYTYLITRLDGIMLPIFIQKIMASDTVLLGRKLCVIQR